MSWSAHLRNICIKYSLPDPLQLLSSGIVWKKTDWSILIKTKITVYHEKELRQLAQNNSKMEYLNVQVQGLSGLPHPALRNILTTRDVLRLRQHIKFLSGDYLTADRLFRDNGTSPRCKLCPAPFETTQHVLTQSRATVDTHSRMLPELLNIVASVDPSCEILNPKMQPWHPAQFLLDCTSLNLPARCRVSAQNPNVYKIFSVSRNWCFGISKARSRLLKLLRKS